MNSELMTKIATAKGACLNTIKLGKDTPAEEHAHNALRWLNHAAKLVNQGLPHRATMQNALTFMQHARFAIQPKLIAINAERN